ncbi:MULTISPECIES: HAD family hydrolase [unclassified Roseovarius]|uniref:HAD family hydrolase n=1 Tax=unclassified Roseovarius TaxID=2614913 RepID=UPI0027400F4D|nr:HAD-IA family hydrolase [Roseovarius sp. MMSF_3350]
MHRTVLITDVDNTLFDWVDIWYRSFRAMLDEVCSISGLREEELYQSISSIHQTHQTSEYAFLLEEVPELHSRYGDKTLEVLSPAIAAFREARREAMRLYPGVSETLEELRAKGIKIVAYTESQEFYTQYRFRKLGLDQLIDYLYSPPDHELPVDDVGALRKYDPERYEMKLTKQMHTPRGEVKPNPHILMSILDDLGVAPEQALYVGDSKMKDIAMAQGAGVLDAWAEYGQAQHREQYELLKKVTHWTPAQVKREAEINSGRDVTPTHTLRDQFSEVLPFFTTSKVAS